MALDDFRFNFSKLLGFSFVDLVNLLMPSLFQTIFGFAVLWPWLLPVVEKLENRDTAREAEPSKSGEEIPEDHEEVADAEHFNDNGEAKITEKGTTSGKESHEDDDELCAMRDAFNTIISQGLSEYQKKLQLKKLMNLGTGKRKELSDEWKALCVEETRLNIKKLRLSAKLAEAGFGS